MSQNKLQVHTSERGIGGEIKLLSGSVVLGSVMYILGSYVSESIFWRERCFNSEYDALKAIEETANQRLGGLKFAA